VGVPVRVGVGVAVRRTVRVVVGVIVRVPVRTVVGVLAVRTVVGVVVAVRILVAMPVVAGVIVRMVVAMPMVVRMLVILVMLVMLVTMPVVVRVAVLAAAARRGGQFLGVGALDRHSVHEDAEPRAGEAAAQRLARLDADAAQAQAGDRFADHGEGHSHVEAGAQEHVAGDAGSAVEVVSGHGGGRLPCAAPARAPAQPAGGRGR
jgi:hypothetical protein